MLLKISDGGEGWVMFDNVDQVHLLPSRNQISSREDLKRLNGAVEGSVNLIAKEQLKGTPIDVGIIEFMRQGTRSRVLFTSVAYVCNDRGDTIERVNVGTQRQVRKR